MQTFSIGSFTYHGSNFYTNLGLKNHMNTQFAQECLVKVCSQKASGAQPYLDEFSIMISVENTGT
jgi:hypothetical protein